MADDFESYEFPHHENNDESDMAHVMRLLAHVVDQQTSLTNIIDYCVTQIEAIKKRLDTIEARNPRGAK